MAFQAISTAPSAVPLQMLEGGPSSSEAAIAGATATGAKDVSAAWREAMKGHRDTGCEFLGRAEAAKNELIIMRVVLEPHTRLTAALLSLGGQKWEVEQIKRALETGKRLYRVSVLASGQLERRCLRQYSGMLRAACWPVSKGGMTASTRSAGVISVYFRVSPGR